MKQSSQTIATIILLLFILNFNACKDDDILPDLTHEGNNTFGCYINGQAWKPLGQLGMSGVGANVVRYTQKDTLTLHIAAENINKKGSFHLYMKNKGQININTQYNLDDRLTSFAEWGNGNICEYDSLIEGYIELSHFNLETGIIAGTFKFTAYSTICKKTVEVTDGRFDIGLVYYSEND